MLGNLGYMGKQPAGDTLFMGNMISIQRAKMDFFGGLGLGQAAPRDKVEEHSFFVASLLDIVGTKVAVVQKRAEVKDYLDIDALLQHGIDLPTALASGTVVYGRSFNPMITLKALSFFDDLPTLPADVRKRLIIAVDVVDPATLPILTPYARRKDENGQRP
jgi:hypothetical protein